MYTNTVGRAQPMRRGEASDRVWSGVILAELRQAAIGYTEAALESTSPDVRRVFERLAYDTARKHEQLTAILQQNRLLEPAFAAPAEEVRRAAAQAAETVRLARTLQAGRAGTPAASAAAPTVPQMSYAPRNQGYSPYMNMQQPQARPPEFALPHNMPFGGLPGGSYVPPQPQAQQPSQAQPQYGAAGTTEAPAPERDPEPAVSSAVREEASLGAVAPPAAASPTAEPAHEAPPTAPPAPKRSGGRRAKASPAVEAAANDPEQLTT
ncbi:spore coat protein [Paenibacillus sp.]|uniref:spore coat protein n=1 Tax=Paenibacillus sp. TaxID=58172 RepID=UPI002811B554|nr:spore coat protein [Paenibacillus sp.]